MIESNCGNSSVDMQLIVNLTNISCTEFYAYKCIYVLVTSIVNIIIPEFCISTTVFLGLAFLNVLLESVN